MTKDIRISLAGDWKMDYLSDQPYTSTAEPTLTKGGYHVSRAVPGYWEDMCDEFRRTELHAKLRYNPLYTLQRYPQAGYVPDMCLPNPVGCFLYSKSFDLSEISEDAVLFFGGVQNRLSAWINGKFIGTHEGYSASFTLDVPADTLTVGENRITLAVSNNRLAGYMDRPVSGLTSRAACECTGGIYGDVELRLYSDGLYDMWVRSSDDLSSFTVYTDSETTTERTLIISDGDKELTRVTILPGESSVILPSDGLSTWSPTSPKLYRATVLSGESRLCCDFGLRRLASVGNRLYLNGKPYYFRGICEHCYHPITVHPTRDAKYYRAVVKRLKSLGFNSIRFHTYVPMEEYMTAADELGMLVEIETPNNTTYAEWCEIIRAARRHPSVLIASSGNEMVIDEDYIAHLSAVAEYLHAESDILLSPMSAMRGIEYHSYGDTRVDDPFPHNPKRLTALSEFCDLYNSYSLGLTSYKSESGDPDTMNLRHTVYDKPLLSHEICIHGTYCDLSLADRYAGSRIGDTELFSSVKRHLADKGLLDRAPVYYRNSVGWQKLLRKSAFELVRLTDSLAGYDFLGDIDTHWHTFGYCVGMMNEFYELKIGETEANVRRYNSDTVLLVDPPRVANFASGAPISLPILASHYGDDLTAATLTVTLRDEHRVYLRRRIACRDIKSGALTELYRLSLRAPRVEVPTELKLSVTLSGGNTDAENEWQLYVFPKPASVSDTALRRRGVTVAESMTADELIARLSRGERVVLLGGAPFPTVPASFQLSVAGRTTGHLATVINDHPLTAAIPHDGFVGRQLGGLMNDASSAVLDLPSIPYEPIIEIASSYKNARREALLFEYAALGGRLLVCTLNLASGDPAAAWLRAELLNYAASDAFAPAIGLTAAELHKLLGITVTAEALNTNAALNKNDITAN